MMVRDDGARCVVELELCDDAERVSELALSYANAIVG